MQVRDNLMVKLILKINRIQIYTNAIVRLKLISIKINSCNKIKV